MKQPKKEEFRSRVYLDRPAYADFEAPQEFIIHDNAMDGLNCLPDKLAHTCITSPPYYGLRDYGVDGQIGLENTPEEYIENLVCVFREIKRVLRDDGTLWLNIGDGYAGSGKGSAYYPESALNAKQGTNKGMLGSAKTKNVGFGKCKPKDLIGIPWMLAFALRADGWYLRQDIIWSKSNAMPESVKDRCTKAHEYIFLLSKSPKYYFDAEAIAEPVAESTIKRLSQDIDSQKGSALPGKTNGNMKAAAPRYGGKKYTATPDVFNRTKSGNCYDYKPMRNKRSVWNVSTAKFKGAHFATFPEKLIKPCVLAGCPAGGVVLDPFFGSGTTGVVAKKLNRGFVGIEINGDYVRMARARIENTHYQLTIKDLKKFNQNILQEA